MAFRVERSGGKGRPVETVATGATADGDDFHPRLDLFVDVLDRDHARRAAEDEGVVNVGIVELDRPADRGDAHAVAVVAHAADDAAHHAERMDDILGLDVVHRGVRCAEAEDVERADRLGALARPEDVADDPAESGVGAGVGLDCTRVVVRFGLQADREIFIEGDETGIVVESGEDEARLAVKNALRDIADVGLEERIDRLGLAVDRVGDRGAEDTVLAMLAPGLGDDLELHVGGLALPAAVDLLDREHVLA